MRSPPGGPPARDRPEGVYPRDWKGFWAFDPSLVADLEEYVAYNL